MRLSAMWRYLQGLLTDRWLRKQLKRDEASSSASYAGHVSKPAYVRPVLAPMVDDFKGLEARTATRSMDENAEPLTDDEYLARKRQLTEAARKEASEHSDASGDVLPGQILTFGWSYDEPDAFIVQVVSPFNVRTVLVEYWLDTRATVGPDHASRYPLREGFSHFVRWLKQRGWVVSIEPTLRLQPPGTNEFDSFEKELFEPPVAFQPLEVRWTDIAHHRPMVR